MPGLRIGIDVGGTFTHGVVLRPPGDVLTTARTPTTHTGEHGVADGVRTVLTDLLRALDELRIARQDIELVAHSTTQATNALLEGDVAPVTRIVIVPPGEMLLARAALRAARLSLGGGHFLPLTTHYVPWEAADQAKALPEVTAGEPVAVIQPLAGGHANREQAVAEHYRRMGLPVVCASEITQVLGLAARARTAAVNASMLPTMLKTADFTEQAVHALLPDVPVQVVRSDGGAMSIDEMRRQPILSLLSGPAAGASAALDLSGLSEVVFVEVGGTSTDITLIREGRVRHRYATVGGQRLMVPALDLRTVAVGGGSMPRVDGKRFGPRSAHIAGLPYLFALLAEGQSFKHLRTWDDTGEVGETRHVLDVADTPVFYSDLSHGGRETYWIAETVNGSLAAVTLTDLWLSERSSDQCQELSGWLGIALDERVLSELRRAIEGLGRPRFERARAQTLRQITVAVRELAHAHSAELAPVTLVGGGGGAPVVHQQIAADLGVPARLAADHTVISAIGAALAVTCASQSRTVAEPTGADIAELTQEVEQRLAAQGAERVATDYEYDPHRQVLTVTGRGSRAYDQEAEVRSSDQLEVQAGELISGPVERVWESSSALLWVGEKRRRACAQSRLGRCLWLGNIRAWFGAEPGRLDEVLGEIVSTRTAYTDGGPALPGLALICSGRFIPLDALASRELISEVLRWENLPADAPGCFIIRG
jgi:N-methylhydantoinase A/oxoprolinase/acetone carboxylase beta subunit